MSNHPYQVRSELPAILALISASNSKTFTKAAISRLSQFTNEAVAKGYLSVADQKRFIGAVLAKPATGRGL